MIVIDASSVVGAALKRNSIPREAILRARARDIIAMSTAVSEEIQEVLGRPKFARHITDPERRAVLDLLRGRAFWIEPTVSVTDCRDPRDDIYLELAIAARAEEIVSSDGDLLALDPWRGIRILRPAVYLGLP